jgi:hypothetical protein
MLHTTDKPRVCGEITPWAYDERSGLILPGRTKPNQIQISWGHIAARQIGFRRGQGRPDFAISGMYLEYENVTNPEDVVDVPDDFPRDENLDYFNDLTGSAVRDYLRVELLQEPLLGIAAGFEAYFTAGVDGNQLTFMAMSAGLEGMTGKAFSSAANSKVVGCALVATPVRADHTQDVIFARTYFDTEDHTVKEPSHQVGVTWSVVFE